MSARLVLEIQAAVMSIAREEQAIAREVQAWQVAEAERAKAEKLEAHLRSLGVDPEQI